MPRTERQREFPARRRDSGVLPELQSRAASRVARQLGPLTTRTRVGARRA
jgi:hypothetical protein